MTRQALWMLRGGLALTFLWISVFIIRNPGGSSAHMVFPWVVAWLPAPIERIMVEVAVVDIVIGLLLLLDWTLWYASLASTLHLLLIFAVTGVNSVTVRNIGLLATSVALAMIVPVPGAVSRLRVSGLRGAGARRTLTVAMVSLVFVALTAYFDGVRINASLLAETAGVSGGAAGAHAGCPRP